METTIWESPRSNIYGKRRKGYHLIDHGHGLTSNTCVFIWKGLVKQMYSHNLANQQLFMAWQSETVAECKERPDIGTLVQEEPS